MEAMLVMLGLYKWSLLAGVLAATALAILGVQLGTRDRGMQTMCIAQGAMFGVLFSLGIVGSEAASHGSLFPLFGSLSAAALCFIATEWVANKRPASKNTFFAFAFSFLLAMSHLVSSIFPALENHLAQIYFGDLATLGTRESWFTSAFSLAAILFLVKLRYFFSSGSFNHAVYGIQNQIRNGFWHRNLFNITAVLMVCFSVQYLGFLFTISLLFVPTAILIFSPRNGLMGHMVLCGGFAALSGAAGFLLSLHFTRLPTVPAIVGILVVFLSSAVATQWIWKAAANAAERYTQKKSERIFEPIST